jgi:GxxExxY protein
MNKIENELSAIVVDTSYQIHVELGPGLFESVYEEILCYELTQYGLSILRQHVVPVSWKGITMDHGFRADIIVENKILIEIKSVETLAPVHYKQTLSYIKLIGLKLGLLINFNEALIKNGIKRIVNNL